MAPAGVLRYASNATTTRTLTFSGLSGGKTYSLELYASRGNYAGNFTSFTVNGGVQSVSTYNNLESKASFSGLSADGAGKIVVTISNAQTYNYLNGFILTEVVEGATTTAAPVSPSALSLETMEVAAAVPGQGSLGASVHPNPSAYVFNLRVRGGSLGEPVSLRVWDVAGRIVEQRTGLSSGATLSLGGLWGTGLYYAELTQGTQKLTLKLIKNK